VRNLKKYSLHILESKSKEELDNELFNELDAPWIGPLERIEDLLKRGADVNMPLHKTSLLEMAAAGHELPSLVRLLIDYGANVNHRDEDGLTVMHMNLSKEVAEVLIERGAEINARSNMGKTPLYNAVASGNEPFVKLLLNNGADVNIPSKSGRMPIDVAYERHRITNKTSIIKDLIEHGADPSSVFGNAHEIAEMFNWDLSWCLNIPASNNRIINDLKKIARSKKIFGRQ
jgi:ankyrin repeat protein